MERWRPSSCRECRTECGPISTRGLCVDCAIKRQTKAATQLAERTGPYYDAWRKSMVAVGKRAREG